MKNNEYPPSEIDRWLEANRMALNLADSSSQSVTNNQQISRATKGELFKKNEMIYTSESSLRGTDRIGLI